ncbi:MAG: (1-_4)-alpha-D-glucan 1-alpha-D-glucosylmutase [Solirubrobacteraceae bacterium]|nr:(1->4)-alpha-D-glucan 1-alpha-D-glucosylmutase [Solirubrobacteraceae bacterium]
MAQLRATYRLQLGPGMGFAQARELVPYLRDLGVSHLYLPPSFQARTGSTHGYDVVDPRSISEELGGRAEFDALVTAAHDAGLGLVLDIVPNHMATDERNRYWSDPALRERFFDIDPGTGRHRRFFDIDDLAGVRQEDPEVFAETHALALELARTGVVDGLRIDHPDGLADPAQYLRRLRDGGAQHVWVEKILSPGESLRDWPVDGTVGYEFLNDVAALWIDPAGEAPLTALWHDVAGDERPFGTWADEAKLEQARGPFAPEADRLRREWPGVEGVEEALASLPVYRTYIVDEPEPEDREVLAQAGLTEWIADAPQRFVTRFQQTTPPVMAKGVEDTAFYRYGRLLALNDVGGDPSRFGISVETFHAANAERARRFPRNLLVTQTHDTKRSGDVRARIGALASMPAEWEAHVRRWFEACSTLEGPDDVERYFLFQTLVGAWPIDADRLEAYMEKALREAKRTSNWIDPDEAHEAAVKRFCRRLLDHRPFLADFVPFAAEVARAGDRAALGQLLFKLTVPGVADVYQGDELLALSLVDPDNRRTVDWASRRRLLDSLRDGAEPTDETRKLWLIWRALEVRARRPEVFDGAYEPLDAGPAACAFLRGGAVAVAAAIRGDGSAVSVRLPPGRWRSLLGGRDAEGETALGPHGLALLERIDDR